MIKKVKVLYIHHGKGIGGAPISLLNLIKCLDKEKYSVKVACLQSGSHIQLFQDAGIEVELVRCSRFYFSHNETGKQQWFYAPFYFIVFFVWLHTAFHTASKYLKSQEYDILHLNSHVLSSWAFAAKRLKSKVVLHNREAITRGYFGLRYAVLKTLLKRNCDHIINISEDNLHRLGIYKRSSVVYNFVDIPSVYRETMSDRTIKRVLFLGGSSTIKGFDTVRKCIYSLDKNIEVIIAGNIEQCGTVFNFSNVICKIRDVFTHKSHKIKEVASAPNVKLLGILKNPYPAIDACDILITPFKKPHFSRPAIEAFAHGKPVVGSDVLGMSEIIDDNKNGLLVRQNDDSALANAINYLCKKPEIARKLGQNGRLKAQHVFSKEANLSKLIEIYDKVQES